MDPVTRSAVLPAPWPVTAQRSADGSIAIGGVPLPELASRYGTPLYVFDEDQLRGSMREFRDAMSASMPGSRVVYAAKAFLTTALVRILRQEGLGIDVVSGGELFMALRGGMPPAEISLHGNNKSQRELAEALAAGVGKIVIDNDHEISLMSALVSGRAEPQPVMIRVNPGVDVNTHQKISTGVADSKFGFPIRDGQALAAALRIAAIPGLNLVGLHAHVGSQLFDAHATTAAIHELLALAAQLRYSAGIEIEHLSPGGGFGIAYLESDEPVTATGWAEALASAIDEGCARHDFPRPTVTIEPGRSIVGPAGIALYEVGATKVLPGIRTYVSVDGGMSDNIRPSLYGATYTATLANREVPPGTDPVTIAGKYCESGDLLIERTCLGDIKPQDLIAIPAAGAYTLSMASNYNAALRPAVALVREGMSRLIRRRETYDDLVRCDLD